MESKEGATSDPEIPDLVAKPKESNPATVPLLLNPAYARTKSLSFDELRKFRISLKWCALDHSSATGKAISYATFILLTAVVPAATSLSIRDPVNTAVGHVSFNKLVQLPVSGLATISFLTLCSFFRRYGLRQLLFLNGLHDDSASVRRGYALELDRSFKYLTYILLPSFSVELAHKIIFFSTVSVQVPFPGIRFPWNSIAFVATLASWVYRTGVFLLVCVLFRLTCELQILRFEGFFKMFEGCGLEAAEIHGEHMRIRRQCLLTSHRYRIFIICCLVSITVSQLGSLMLVLASRSQKSFCNSGDLVASPLSLIAFVEMVCSAVQLSGFFMCLMGAARITHRAQKAVAIASRWHMIMSVNKQASAPKTIHELDDPSSTCSPQPNVSEPAKLPPSQQISSFQSRQALVMYLQHNGGGITLFGFALDRGLLHTLFVFEMTLVLWILSKVVVLS